ncbi:cyclic GMP-AMP synthase-like receptor isoform X2 [Eurosta solidaginis]|uniref:cyclic GMP-AMP synthase-like receptor isoform X2 n=1 Tax=Eurosta solidaginis TaxID=178769 RepID=UPI0035309290
MDNIFAKINKDINIKPFRRQYMNNLECLRNSILSKLKNDEVFSKFYNGVYLKGSYGDNLKVKYPDEYDLVIRLKLPEIHRIIVVKDHKVPGNVILDLTEVLQTISNQTQHVKTHKVLKKCVNEHNLLSIRLLQSWLEGRFTKALQDLHSQIVFEGTVSAITYRKQGPAHTIFIKTPYKYSVDFVPAIVLCPSQAITYVTGSWDAIPKPIKDVPNVISFRASYDCLENELINDKKTLKNALRIMKKFRDRHQNMSNLKSYYIKTLFLWRAAKESTFFWSQPISCVVIALFQDLRTSLKERNLPFFWDKELNLYEKIGEAAILEMTKCVVCKTDALEKYKIIRKKSINDDFKIYEIFLTEEERIRMGIRKMAITPTNEATQFFTEREEVTTPDVSSWSKCIMS